MTRETVTILIDSREQRPLLFPEVLALWSSSCGAGRKPTAKIVSVVTEKAALAEGDYCLAGDGPPTAIVERKSGIDELIGNLLTSDRPRFLRAITRLAANTCHPYLYIEAWPDAWWRGTEMNRINPDLKVVQAMDLILHEVAHLGIGLLWGNRASQLPAGRRRAGELILRILLAHKEQNE